MQTDTERLMTSKLAHEAKTAEDARADGERWARENAEYVELSRLARVWPEMGTTQSDDAYGAPGVFLRSIARNRDLVDRAAIDGFWTVELGKDRDAEDQYSALYWDAFVEGAIRVHEALPV